jgi:hypothetical protein
MMTGMMRFLLWSRMTKGLLVTSILDSKYGKKPEESRTDKEVNKHTQTVSLPGNSLRYVLAQNSLYEIQ